MFIYFNRVYLVPIHLHLFKPFPSVELSLLWCFLHLGLPFNFSLTDAFYTFSRPSSRLSCFYTPSPIHQVVFDLMLSATPPILFEPVKSSLMLSTLSSVPRSSRFWCFLHPLPLAESSLMLSTQHFLSDPWCIFRPVADFTNIAYYIIRFYHGCYYVYNNSCTFFFSWSRLWRSPMQRFAGSRFFNILLRAVIRGRN